LERRVLRGPDCQEAEEDPGGEEEGNKKAAPNLMARRRGRMCPKGHLLPAIHWTQIGMETIF